jgi:anti-anti-sigma factor
MELRFTEQAERLTIAFCGDLDNEAAPEVEKKLTRVFMQDEYDILLDCTDLRYISSNGLRLLVTLYKHIRDTGHKAFIRKMNKNVKEALEIGGFLNIDEEIE